ncbi:hypothetical protein JCM10908_007253 [Rhodotorula pacifica]|uniref:uncharacterized protein n=1 Tax=Rhodotorula pacifica TaxID=1495444 RepID=UPI003177DC63
MSTSSSSSASPPASTCQDTLTRTQLASSFGARLFLIWLDRDQTGSSIPNIDLPAVDFWLLYLRFMDAGQQLKRLTPVDELLCRVTYASVAPLHFPDRVAGNSRGDIARHLLQEAEARADELLIWRNVKIEHVAPLLLLACAKSTAEPAGDASTPYFAAATSQFRQLMRGSTTNIDEGSQPMRQLGWSLIVGDVFRAAERRERPNLLRNEISTLLAGSPPIFPTLERLLEDARVSAADSMDRMLQAIHIGVLVAHDTATYVSSQSVSVEEITSLWLRLDEMYNWSRHTLFAVHDPSLVGWNLTRIYTHVVWVTALVLEATLIQHLSEMITQSATSNTWTCGLQDTEHISGLITMCGHGNKRLSRGLCALLRLPQEQPDLRRLHIFSMVPGVICSVSRVLDLANAFVTAPASDQTLFPLGASDKLASVRHLEVQIRYLSRGYPSAHMTSTLAALDAEAGILSAMTMTDQAHDTSFPPPSEAPLVPDLSNASANASTVSTHSTLAATISPADEPLLSPFFFSHSLFDPSLSDYPSDLSTGSPEGAWRWEMV